MWYFGSPIRRLMKVVYPVLLPDPSMETVSPELRRCLRRIFSLARHSRNSAAPFLSNAWSGTRLNRRSPPASGASVLRVTHSAHTRARGQIFHGPFYGSTVFGCKTAQHRENLCKNSLGNYKSAALDQMSYAGVFPHTKAAVSASIKTWS
jgi:hypothetical protein